MISAGETSRNDKLQFAWGLTGQHACQSCKHCKLCTRHAHIPLLHARACLHKFHSVGNSNQHLPVQCNNELNRQRDCAGETSRTRQITSCLGRDGQHARRTCKHCKPCAKHAHAPPPRARTRLYKFHSVGNSHQPVPVHINNDLKQQRHGAGETSRNDKLRVAWEGMSNTRARRANTADRAPDMLTHYHYVRAHVCTSSIQWAIQTKHHQFAEQYVENRNTR